MNKCYICKKELSPKEGLGSGVDKYGMFPKEKEEEVIVCSKECGDKFEEMLPFKGKPIDHYSRVTGYVQRVSVWNDGKKQEFGDRKRYDLGR
jgi:anaerobic ribonucleoside-triphosphate reductase